MTRLLFCLIAIACLRVLSDSNPQKPINSQSLVKSNVPAVQTAEAPPAAPAGKANFNKIFKGGSQSPVARSVGHAEGTRTANGGYTRAFRGHTDPGNGVWNLGTFSFQHCQEQKYRCSTAEQADGHQLNRLKRQAKQLRKRAEQNGIVMSIQEELNAIDLVNQSPRAALGRRLAYVERLAQAKRKGLKGKDAILFARVWAFWDPVRQRWAAPGLGNTEPRITRDQRRRMLAVNAVINRLPKERLISFKKDEALDLYLNSIQEIGLPEIIDDEVEVEDLSDEE